MKFIVEVPDAKADEAAELVARIKRKGGGEAWLSVGEPGIGSPVSDSWLAAEVLPVAVRKQGP